MTPHRRSAALLLALGLAACGTTPPTHYLTLAVAPGPPPRAAAAGLVLRPPEVRWPAAFDRLEVTRPTAGVEVTVESFARWTAAPGALAASALTADLLTRLPAAAVAPWSDPTPRDAVAVTVSMDTLTARPSGYRLGATVSVARGATVRRWVFQGEAAGAQDAQGEAEAASSLLGQLADRIAEDLSAPAAASDPTASPRPRP